MERLRSLRRKQRYTQVSNDALDALPDLNSVGLLAHILRNADDFQFDLKTFARSKPGVGEQAVFKARRTLIQHGYLVQIKFRHSYRGRFATVLYRSAEPHTEMDIDEICARYAPGRITTVEVGRDEYGDAVEQSVTIRWAEVTSSRGTELLEASPVPGSPDPGNPGSGATRGNRVFPQVPPDPGFPGPGQPGPGEPGSKKKTKKKTKEKTREEDLSPGPLGPVQVRHARARDDAARANPEQKSNEPSPTGAALAVVARLPRRWRDGVPGWLLQRLTERIDRALAGQASDGPTAPLGADAIVAGVERFGDPDAVGAALGDDTDGARHLDALAAVLRTVRSEVAGGTWCRLCGPPDRCGCSSRPRPRLVVVADEPDTEPLVRGEAGHCDACGRDDRTAAVDESLPLRPAVCDACREQLHAS